MHWRRKRPRFRWSRREAKSSLRWRRKRPRFRQCRRAAKPSSRWRRKRRRFRQCRREAKSSLRWRSSVLSLFACWRRPSERRLESADAHLLYARMSADRDAHSPMASRLRGGAWCCGTVLLLYARMSAGRVADSGCESCSGGGASYWRGAIGGVAAMKCISEVDASRSDDGGMRDFVGRGGWKIGAPEERRRRGRRCSGEGRGGGRGSV